MPILQKLSEGDLRTTGASEEVAAEVLANPSLFAELFEGMIHADPHIRMRAADAVEKVTRGHPEYLQPYKEKLISHVAQIEQQEVRWHAAQLFTRLDLNAEERVRVRGILLEYLRDRSKIVKTFSMQAITDLAMKDKTLQQETISILEELTLTGSPAMRSRGRKLLKKLQTS